MKLTLIHLPALLPVLLLSSQIVLAADPVPKFDTGPICRSAGAAAVMATRNTASCEQDENNARATLEKEWSQFTDQVTGSRCTGTGSATGSPRASSAPCATSPCATWTWSTTGSSTPAPSPSSANQAASHRRTPRRGTGRRPPRSGPHDQAPTIRAPRSGPHDQAPTIRLGGRGADAVTGRGR